MLIKLSSKGQIVIPKSIRKNLGLAIGDQFHVKIDDDKIILQRVTVSSLIDSLHGRFKETNLLAELEHEHSQEIEDDKKEIRP